MSQELIKEMLKDLYDSDFRCQIDYDEEYECTYEDKENFYTDCAQKICDGKITSLSEVRGLIEDFVQECYQDYKDILGDCLAEAALPDL
jgi:hypothetical protein